jgi:hypothetical protein
MARVVVRDMSTWDMGWAIEGEVCTDLDRATP